MAGCRNRSDIIHTNLVTFNSETGKLSDCFNAVEIMNKVDES